jgi:methionyl-tRNA formyltransferase
MRVAFMGTPAFAVPSLDALLTRHEVVAVYTRPDRASGRGRHIVPSLVKRRAEAVGIPVEQPVSLRDPESARHVATYAPDVIVVAAYGLILPAEILEIPALGCVNVHGSLLPRWRGAAPVQRAILAGDATTGVSIMRMEVGLDTGPWCVQAPVVVDDKSAAVLTDELASVGADALLRALDAIERGDAVWTPQDDTLVTYADKITAADVALSPDLTVETALRRVRAAGPSAPCRLSLSGKRLVALEASRSGASLPPGAAACVREIELGLADGAIRLDVLVPEGRSSMTGDAFARGARLGDPCTWSAA